MHPRLVWINLVPRLTDKSDQAGIAHLHLSKTIDSVSHIKLKVVYKLKRHGVDGLILMWFTAVGRC